MYRYTPANLWGWYGLFALFRTLLIIFILALIFKWIFGSHHDWHHHDKKSALDYLKERYAKGEITKKEYEEMKKELQED